MITCWVTDNILKNSLKKHPHQYNHDIWQSNEHQGPRPEFDCLCHYSFWLLLLCKFVRYIFGGTGGGFARTKFKLLLKLFKAKFIVFKLTFVKLLPLPPPLNGARGGGGGAFFGFTMTFLFWSCRLSGGGFGGFFFPMDLQNFSCVPGRHWISPTLEVVVCKIFEDACLDNGFGGNTMDVDT